MKLSCLIADDEPNAVALLTTFVQQIPFLDLRYQCFDAFEALSYLQTEKIDIILLDITMPGLSGMELAALLPKGACCIFITAHSEYAVESYEKNAVDYLVKPITFQRFLQAVIKAVDKLNAKLVDPNMFPWFTQQDDIFIKHGKQLVRLEYASILYIQGEKEYVKLVTATNSFLVYKRMKEVADVLPPYFERIHLSSIINLRHVKKIEDNHVWIGNQSLSISDTYRQSFLTNVYKKLL